MNWPETRQQILTELKKTRLSMMPPLVNEIEISELQSVYRRFDLLLEEFAENLPQHVVSRCPHCNELLELSIDLAGLDSPWWWDACPVPFAPARACKHFQVFLGAVDLHGRAPVEADTFPVLPGPGVPFVIERLLLMEGMKAVVSTMTIGASDSGYLIAYFSEEPVDQTMLHQEWRKQTWTLFDDDGESIAENLVNDPWDFELGPWLDSEALLWIGEGDSNFTLVTGMPCPFEGLSGIRMKQIISSGELDVEKPPTGRDPDYYGHDDWEEDEDDEWEESDDEWDGSELETDQ